MQQTFHSLSKTKFRIGAFLLMFLFGVLFVGSTAAANYPEPTYGTATVDGLTGDWDTNNDFFAEMYRAGNPDSPNHPVESNLYVRYDCETQTIFVLVLSVNGQNVLLQPDDAFVKLGNSTKLVDGNDPNFEWVNSNGSNAEGFEASASLNIGSYSNLNVHVQVFTDGESQTSAVADRAIDLVIDCTDDPPPNGTLLVQKVVPDGEGNPNNPDQTFELDILNENGVGIAGATVKAGAAPVGLGFAPGSYGVAEVDLAAGWTLDDISCESRDGTSTFGNFTPGDMSLDVELGAGDRVLCTFTNSYDPPSGSLTIVKVAAVADGTDFAFTSDIPGGSSFTLDVDDDNTLDDTITFDDIPVGSYTITELVPDGWSIRFARCNGGSDEGTLDGNALQVALAADEDITCTFNNSVNANIIVNKDVTTDGADEDLEFHLFFNSSIPDYYAHFYLSETESNTPGRTDGVFEDISTPVLFTIEEQDIPAGWALQDIECTSSDGNTNITKLLDQPNPKVELRINAQGDDIECTFINSRTGSITIKKNVDDNAFSGMDFDFVFDGQTDFSISEDDTAGFVVEDLLPGNYPVTEAVPDGWDLDTIDCGNGNNNTALSNGLTVVLEPGEDAVCTFNNVKLGSITILKNVDDDNFSDMDFDFTFDGQTDFSISEDDAAGFVVTNLPAGDYPVTEAVPDGWDLDTIDCGNGNNNTALANGLTVVLEEGEDAVCTFNNVKLGSITILKNVDNDAFSGMNFNFTFNNQTNFSLSEDDTDGFVVTNLPAGNYPVTENVPADWDLDTIDCGNGNNNTALTGGLTIVLEDGEDAVCTFNNVYEPTTGTLEVTKVVDWNGVPLDQNQTFEICIQGPSYPVGDEQGACQEADYVGSLLTWADLLPGDYAVSETNPGQEWTVSGENSVSVVVGETAELTITNTRDMPNSITIVKDVIGDNANTAQTFQIFHNSSNPDFVPPGTATISEDDGEVVLFTNVRDNLLIQLREQNLPQDWTFVSLDCVSEAGTTFTYPADQDGREVRFTIREGDNITCTWTNEYTPPPTTGNITVIKEVVYEADIDVDSDRDFNFFSTELGNFILDDPLNDDADGVTNTASFTNLAPGEYTVSENPNGNWIQSVECVGDDGVTYLNPDTGATIDLDAGEDVVCTFTNERVVYDLTYEKVLADGTPALDGDWEFTLASLLNLVPGDIDQDFGVVTTIDGAGGSDTLTLPLDAYKVGEDVPAGYDLVQINCGDGGVSTSPPVNDQFTIILDQDLTCTFTNKIELKKISPILECVAPIIGTDMYRAYFGYNNPNDETVEIPVGPNNKFTPAPQNQGQPTEFAPGRTPYFPNAAFSVDFDGSNLVWTLNGKTATASNNPVQRCEFHVEIDKEWTGDDAPDQDLVELISASSSSDAISCDWDGVELVCSAENLNVPAVIENDELVGHYSVSEDGLPEGWNILSGIGDFSVPNDNCDGKFCSHTVVNEKEKLQLERLIPDCFDAENDQYRWRVRNANDVSIDFTLTNPAGDVILASGTAAPNGDTVVYTDKDTTTFPTILRVDGVEQPKGRKNPNVNPCAPTTGKITVVKQIDWGQQADEYPDPQFNFSGDLGDFTLGGGESDTFELLAGSYDITELYKYNWAIGNVSCDGGNPEQIARGINIDLEAGDDITCTFVNEPNCVNPRADLSAVITWDEGTAMGHVTNDSDALCVWEVGMASYEKYNEVIDEQDLFDWTDGNPVAPGETIKMTIDKPECAVQIDVFVGEVLFSLDGNRYGDRLLAWQHLHQDGYCERPMSKVDGYVSADGAGLQGVIVTLTNTQADGLTFEVTTNIDGYYAFREVPSGSYHVEISGDVLGGMDIAATSAIVEVGAATPAVANFTAENSAPTAVTLSATTATTSGNAMLITIIAAVLMLATIALWRRPEEQG